jgi:hypothetical protein
MFVFKKWVINFKGSELIIIELVVLDRIKGIGDLRW